jgi:hypothetical protein
LFTCCCVSSFLKARTGTSHAGMMVPETKGVPLEDIEKQLGIA